MTDFDDGAECLLNGFGRLLVLVAEWHLGECDTVVVESLFIETLIRTKQNSYRYCVKCCCLLTGTAVRCLHTRIHLLRLRNVNKHRRKSEIRNA